MPKKLIVVLSSLLITLICIFALSGDAVTGIDSVSAISYADTASSPSPIRVYNTAADSSSTDASVESAVSDDSSDESDEEEMDLSFLTESKYREELEPQIWDYLISQYHNPYAAAAILGNCYCESGICPYRIESDTDPGEDGDYPMSKRYLARVDSGELTKYDFMYNGYGGGAFGLFAWTDPTRKGNLYDFAKARGVSLGDWKMQCDFAYSEIVERYYKLYRILLTSDDLHECCDGFMFTFEKASRGDSDGTSNKRWWLTHIYFDLYAGEDTVFESPLGDFDLLPIYESYEYLDTVTLCPSMEKNMFTYLLQTSLTRLGYSVEDYNGVFDWGTKQSVMKMQSDYGLEATGIVTQKEWEILSDGLNLDVETLWTYPETTE